MSRYLVIHHPQYPNTDTLDPFIDAARNLMASLTPEVRWLNSWWAANRELLICEWEAPSEDILRETLQRVCTLWPVDQFYEVIWTDPRWYQEIEAPGA
jgi:hypothetical protein